MASTNTLEILIRANDQASKVLSGVTKNVSGSFSSMGASMVKTGAIMAGATAPFVAALATTVNAAAQFDASMTNVGAVLGKDADEMAALNAEVLAIGAASQAGPQAAAAAFYDIVGGVADASTHMAILNAAIATSEAGQADLGATTSALIAVMNSYGLSADDAAMVSDVLTQTVGKGVGSMEEFAAALPQVTGLANSLGVEFMDVGAAMAFMTTKGFTATQSSTQLKAMMTAMINPNEAMITALEEAGFASGQLAIEQLGLVGAFEALSSESPTFQDNMAGALGSVEALNGVIALTDEGFQEFSDNFASSAEGATEAARKIQMDSFAAQMDVLNSSAEALKIQIGLALLPTITRLVRAAQPVIQSLIQWAAANQPLIAMIAKVVAGVAAFGAILTVAGAGLSLVGGLLAALFSPLGLIIGAIALLGIAIKENFLGIGDIFTSLVEGVKQFAGELTAAFNTGGFAAVGQLILDKLASGLTSVVTWVSTNIITPIVDAINTGDWSAITGKLDPIISAIMGGATSIATVVNETIITPIVNELSAIDWSAVPGQLGALLDKIMVAAEPVSTLVQTAVVDPLIAQLSAIDWSAVPGKLGDIFERLLQMEVSIFQLAVDHILNPLSSQISRLPWEATISGALDTIMEALLTGATSVGDWLNEKVWTPLQTGLGDSAQVQGLSTKAGEAAAAILTGLVNGIGDIAAWVKTNVIDKIISSLSGGGAEGGGVQSGGASLGTSILTGIATAFENMITWTWNNIVWPFVSGLTGAGNIEQLKANVLVLGEELLNGILDGIGDLADFVWNDIIVPLGTQLIAYAPNVAEWAINVGTEIVNGILDGLIGVGQKILDFIMAELAAVANVELIPGSGLSLSNLGSALGSVPGLAAGGPVAAGLPVIVGERGPELFVPRTAGRIVPNDKLGMTSTGEVFSGGTVMNLNGANIVLPGVTNARQFFNELEREAKRRNRQLAPSRRGMQ